MEIVIIEVLSALFIFAFVLAWLFLIKEGFLFYRSLVIGEKNMTAKRMWGIGIAISYIITALVCGLLSL